MRVRRAWSALLLGWGGAALGVMIGACGDDAGVVRDATVVDRDGGEAGPPPDGSRPDARPADCLGLGEPCPDGMCEQGVCGFPEMQGTLGGTDDPVEEFDGGIEQTSWHGGYCVPVHFSRDTPRPCDPDDENDETCGPCGECFEGPGVTFCLRKCEPALDRNTCRPGYECALDARVCLPGCESDDECRIYRADTNDNGTIDEYDPADNPGGDNLVYDTESDATCNDTTNRCEHGGTPGAEAGIPCAKDSDCEANGRCLSEAGTDGIFPGGYCVRDGCELDGVECAGDGRCLDVFGLPLCLATCQVALQDGGDRFTSTSGCREGYACNWNGVDGAGRQDNGGCAPGNFNDLRTPNLGTACTTHDTCFSPFGLGGCLAQLPNGYCTVFDCGAPGMPTDVCGTEGVCGAVEGGSTSLCLRACESGADCEAPSGCYDTSLAGIDTNGQTVCFPGCLEDGDCRPGERCDGTTETQLGQCLPGG